VLDARSLHVDSVNVINTKLQVEQRDVSDAQCAQNRVIAIWRTKSHSDAKSVKVLVDDQQSSQF
jgi:hypothetical protein